MKNHIKNLYKIFLLFFLTCIFVYICAIDGIPSNIILFENEELNIKTIFGISIANKENSETVLTSTLNDENITNSQIGTKNLEVKLFNIFDVKDVKINVIERTKVVPVGEIAGLKLYTSGALVVGMSEVKGMDNVKYKPYENSEIEEGDMIVKINDTEVSDKSKLIEIVNNSNGNELKITYIRNDESLECNITPIKTSKSEYKLGLWVRDSAAGIGTITYYEPSTGNFAALGHRCN